MATLKQRRAIDELVGNGGMSIAKAMIKSGYTEATANTPSKLTESKGFKQICEEIGLTDNFLTKALYNDIKNKPSKRLGELSLAFEITGRKRDIENKQFIPVPVIIKLENNDNIITQ